MSLLLLALATADGATLAEYMDAAAANNPRGALARSAADTASADALAAGSALLPTVRVSAAWTYNQYDAIALLPDPTGGPPEEIVIIPREQRQAVVTGRVPIYDGAALATWQASRDGTEAARQDERATLQNLRFEVARAWYAAVAAQEVVAAADRARAAAEENLRYLSLREAAGAATPLSVQRAELEVANAEQVRVDALRTSANARRALATASGLPEPETLPVTPADLAPPPDEATVL
ncbi:MAG: TolC family protein, partial [Deltaproteobacteria bacterium]|nr:TolC family protein [Deltaproteobacteria bacterium]